MPGGNAQAGDAVMNSCVRARRGRGGARRLRPGNRHGAFTLIELMAAMVTVSALVGMAIPRFQSLREQTKMLKAVGDIHIMQLEIENLELLPASLADIRRQGLLDPWGNPYIYYPFPPGGHGNAPPAGARRDRFLVPVNSKYDLYSMGADGETATAFTSSKSRDDVVRAADGSYIGLASKF